MSLHFIPPYESLSSEPQQGKWQLWPPHAHTSLSQNLGGDTLMIVETPEVP